MKKNIKIILLSGILITLLLGTFAFPFTTQATDDESDLVTCSTDYEDSQTLPDQQKTLVINALKKVYESLGWQKCDCPYEGDNLSTYPTETGTSYKCNQNQAGAYVYNINGEEDITNDLEKLDSCGDFNKELECLQQQSDISVSAFSSTNTRNKLIAAAKDYLQNPSSENKEPIKKLTEQLNLDIKAESYSGGGLLGTVIQQLARALIWSTQPSTYHGYTIDNQGVKTVWGDMCKFVNIGLIIAMILMAMATILGIEKYSWKKMLWKIVLVALLVNFSLVIVGMIVDLFNYFTVFFLNSAVLDAGNFGSLFVFNGQLSGMGSLLSGIAKWFFSNLIVLFVGILVIIILLVALLAMIARAIVIMFLAAIAPLAFAAWIFPDTEKWWKMWWDNFLKWASFGLLFSISLYVGMTIVSSIQYQNIDVVDISFFEAMFTTIMAAAFLLIGLIFSLQSGTAASQFILKQSGKIGGAGGRLIRRKVGETIQGSQAFRTVGKKLTQVPILNQVGYNMLNQSDRARFTNIRKHKEEMKGWDKEEIMYIANKKAPLRSNKESYANYMAARSRALEEGWIGNEDGALEAIRNDVRNNNPDLNVKEIANAFPQFFHIDENGKLEETDPENVDQVLKNISKISPEKMPKHTERIVQAIKDAGGDIDEFLQRSVLLKTNQLRAFLDNVSEDEYSTGKVFGGTTDEPKPWHGKDGQVITRIKQAEKDASDEYKNSVGKLGVTQEDLQIAMDEWMRAQAALDKLNDKLNSSLSLRETLNTQKA